MSDSAVSLACAALYAAAGFCVFLIILNRFIGVMREGRAKKALTLFLLMVFGIVPSATGWLLPHLPWVAIPVAVLAAVSVGEGRRFVLRRRYAGSLPVGSVPHAGPLGLPITTTRLDRHRYQLVLPAWQGPPFRIVHLTDLHVTRRLPFEYFEDAMRATEQEAPDFVFMTGDFLNHAEDIEAVRRLLRPVGRLGTFAVLGNHDYWTDPELLRRVVVDAGVTLLDGNTVEMRLGDSSLLISGWDHPWSRHALPRPECPSGSAHLLLSHYPDNIFAAAETGVHAMFAGHHHGGQIRIPFLGAVIVPSSYGRLFDHGHYEVHGTHLFVPAGVGASEPVLRLYCAPDLFVVDVLGKH